MAENPIDLGLKGAYVLDRIRNEIMGRMVEDSVLLETKLANPKKQVFVLQFAVGEFDMVIFDPVAVSCAIYEIKHSTEIVPEQVRHLNDPQKCAPNTATARSQANASCIAARHRTWMG